MVKKIFITSDERGSLLVVVPLVICLLLAALGISGYVTNSRQTLKMVSLKQQAHKHTEKILAHIRELIITNDDSCGNFSVLKDASQAVGNPISFSTPQALVPCFLDSSEAALYRAFNLTVSRVARADDASISSTMVEIQIQYSTDTFPPLTGQVNRQLSINLASSINFAAIFRSTGNVITVDPKSTLIISGKTLVSNGNSPLDMQTFTSPSLFSTTVPNIFFQDTLFTTGPSVGSGQYFSVNSLLSHFYGGIQQSAFNGISGLPFDSGTGWTQPMDYFWVYNSVGGFPLPSSVVGAANGPGFELADATRAGITNFPDGVVLTKLNQTCANSPAAQGSINNMILLQKGKSVSLNFSNSSIFCGLIIADALNVTLALGVEAAIYGHINVTHLTVSGGGTLYILNPFDFVTTPATAVLPTSVSVQNLAGNFLTLKSTVAHNFFSPFGNSVPTEFAPSSLEQYFETCTATGPTGGIVTNQCWKPAIQSPDLSKLYTPGWYKDMSFTVRDSL